MEAVEVRRSADEGFWVSARAESLAEAQAAVNRLLTMPPPEAYQPVGREAYKAALERYVNEGINDAAEHAAMNAVPDLPPDAAALMDRLEASEEPTTGLRAGKASEPCAYGDGS